MTGATKPHLKNLSSLIMPWKTLLATLIISNSDVTFTKQRFGTVGSVGFHLAVSTSIQSRASYHKSPESFL